MMRAFDRAAAWQRISLGAVVLLVLLASSWLLAHSTADSAPSEPAQGDSAPTETPAAPEPERPEAELPSSSPSSAAGSEGADVGPPGTSDPLEYAAAAAQALWSYDTRTTRHAERVQQLQAWMSPEKEVRDWDSVADQIPDPQLWGRLAENSQHATAEALDVWFPAAFEQALRDDPQAITHAYLYAVTVHGRQEIRWADGGRGGETRMVTLAVQCRPGQPCTLAGRLPGVAH